MLCHSTGETELRKAINAIIKFAFAMMSSTRTPAKIF